jgi:pimeloyl-ACP methyl ester carboxylesterase
MDELSVDVGNGRALGYREYGAPDGRPVVNCHGGLLCGLDVASFGDAASALGVRIISPDRPGIASSDAAPGRNTAHWAGDVRALLDHLDITQSGVLGWSMDRRFTRLSHHHPHVASTTFKVHQADILRAFTE